MVEARTLPDGQLIDGFHTAQEAAAALREWWMEEPEGPQGFVVCSEAGDFYAVLLRDRTDPEVCHTLWHTGQVEHHRCHYLLTSDGRFGRSVVEPCNGKATQRLPAGWASV